MRAHARPDSNKLKANAKGYLNNSRIGRGADLSEAAAGDCGIRLAKLRVVQHIESLPSKLRSQSLADEECLG